MKDDGRAIAYSEREGEFTFAKTESVAVRTYPYYQYLTKKVISRLQTSRRPCSTSWRKNSWHDEITSLSPICILLYKPMVCMTLNGSLHLNFHTVPEKESLML